jgi:hypothetical protein
MQQRSFLSQMIKIMLLGLTLALIMAACSREEPTPTPEPLEPVEAGPAAPETETTAPV